VSETEVVLPPMDCALVKLSLGGAGGGAVCAVLIPEQSNSAPKTKATIIARLIEDLGFLPTHIPFTEPKDLLIRSSPFNVRVYL
jgi:hypothetical protein